MTLLTRITRLLKADLHGILEHLEEPEDVVKQAIRDMEEELVRQEAAHTALSTALQRLQREAQDIAGTRQDLERQIDLCFGAGNEALARNLLRKRLETARRAQRVAHTQDETRTQQESLARTIAAHRAQLATVVQKLQMYMEARPQSRWASTACVPSQGVSAITDDEVEVAFLEEQQRRTAHARP